MTRPKKRTLWIAGIAVAAVAAVGAGFLLAGGPNNAGRFAQEIPEGCAPVIALAFRGSGEANLEPTVRENIGAPYRYGNSELVTNGWEGVTLRGLLAELADTTYRGFRADAIPVIPVGPAGEDEPFGYDAVDAISEASSLESALTLDGSRLLHSAQRGAEAATHIMQEYLGSAAGCPVLPSFVLIGYSQGAMAARHTAELNPASVIGVVNIGDPYQRPDGTGVRAGGAGGTGIVRWKADESQRERLDAYYSVSGERTSICHEGDPICEFSPVLGLWKLATGTYGDHMDYYSASYPEEAPTDAQLIARLAQERQRVALAALEAGESVSADLARSLGPDAVTLRTVSLAFAGTPSLVSALGDGPRDPALSYEFDLDGDGRFETPSASGLAWVDPGVGSHPLAVRVSDTRSGEVTEAGSRIEVAPREDALVAAKPGLDISAPGSVARGQNLPVTVSGGVPSEAALLPLGGAEGDVVALPLGAAWSGTVPIPESVQPGNYRLVLGAEDLSWGQSALAVLAEPEDPAPAVPPAAVAPAPRPAVLPRPGPPPASPSAVLPTGVAPAPAAPPVPTPGPSPTPQPGVPAASPEIWVRDSPVSAGGTLTVGGTGFIPGSIIVLDAPGLGPLATLSADADAAGAFTAVLGIPAGAAPGEYRIVVRETAVGAAFIVSARPRVSLLGSPVPRGGTLEARGTGFLPGESVLLMAEGLGVETRVEAGPDGGWSFPIAIPEWAEAGDYVLIVRGDDYAQNHGFLVSEGEWAPVN
ncbi:cutinase family protein [Mycetocola spongiae]|uniref:cutinase family protein n=1 Tax=Mycetocola spongiae TaxID=2859226 RepID=UPI001CF367FC|nr:cutinase family protein [Mycetocola spongiae]UCR87842.1 cutinase family protein [Mycetocola spongiae]